MEIEKDIARLKRLYVDMEYRRKGLGQRLLDKVVEFCKSKNYKKIILGTLPEMKEAMGLYEKNGFKEFKRDKGVYFEKIL